MVHRRSAKISLKIGAIMNSCLLIKVGLVCSLINSLIASANGWGSPIRDTLFGPFRIWKYPINFRSIRV